MLGRNKKFVIVVILINKKKQLFIEQTFSSMVRCQFGIMAKELHQKCRGEVIGHKLARMTWF